MARRKVRCCGGRSCAPLVRRSSGRACNWANSCAGEKSSICAAHSSKASGRQSSRVQMAAMVDRFSSLSAKFSSTACERWVKRSTAAANSSGGTLQRCSARRWSRSRLVARIVTPGHSASSVAISEGALSICSRLSRSRSKRWWLNSSTKRSAGALRLTSPGASVATRVAAIIVASFTAANGTKRAPSA